MNRAPGLSNMEAMSLDSLNSLCEAFVSGADWVKETMNHSNTVVQRLEAE